MNIEFTETIRERLKSARKQMGMTLAELADGTGYALTTFSGAENGRDIPSPRLLEVWIRRLQLSEEWLVTGKARMFREEPAISFFVLPPKQIEVLEMRAQTLRDHAAVILQEAEHLETIIRESKAIHKSAGGDATVKYEITNDAAKGETWTPVAPDGQ